MHKCAILLAVLPVLANGIYTDVEEEFYDERPKPQIYSNLNELQAFLDENMPIKDNLKALELNSHNFPKAIENGVTFVMFYAPWCPYCQNLKPKWDELAQTTRNGIRIAKVDCAAAENKGFCDQQQIKGYPTLFVYKNGQKQNKYHGELSVPEMQNFINKYLF